MSDFRGGEYFLLDFQSVEVGIFRVPIFHEGNVGFSELAMADVGISLLWKMSGLDIVRYLYDLSYYSLLKSQSRCDIYIYLLPLIFNLAPYFPPLAFKATASSLYSCMLL